MVLVQVLGLVQLGWAWFGCKSLNSKFESSRPNKNFIMIQILFRGVPVPVWVQVLGLVQLGLAWFGA